MAVAPVVALVPDHRQLRIAEVKAHNPERKTPSPTCRSASAATPCSLIPTNGCTDPQPRLKKKARILLSENPGHKPGNNLLSHPSGGALPSAVRGLTVVFEMGTCVSPSLCSPESSTLETEDIRKKMPDISRQVTRRMVNSGYCGCVTALNSSLASMKPSGICHLESYVSGTLAGSGQ